MLRPNAARYQGCDGRARGPIVTEDGLLMHCSGSLPHPGPPALSPKYCFGPMKSQPAAYLTLGSWK